MKTLGIDVGSRFVKLVGFEERILFTEKMDTIGFYRGCRTPQGGLDINRLEVFRRVPFDFDSIVSTGYGRHSVRIDGSTVISEIKAHTLGAMHQTGFSDFTLIDLGGQDTKVVRVIGGEVEDFVMNDRCAAGSGRYLENIARALGLSNEEVARHWENPATLSVTCAIFGESEVIGHLAEGVSIERICAGANLSVAQRLLPLARKFHSQKFVLTGGVAKNEAVVRFLKERCEGEVVVPEHPTFNGALGCASFKDSPAASSLGS